MNREILFRGERVDNGGWVYGDLLCNWTVPQILSEEDGNEYLVIPDTVGQFTGLTDKNGVKIFEGDKVKMVGSMVVYVVEYKFASFWMTGNHYSTILDDHDSSFEVIGNIHDNPELIK